MELCVANETRALTALGGARTGDLPGLVRGQAVLETSVLVNFLKIDREQGESRAVPAEAAISDSTAGRQRGTLCPQRLSVTVQVRRARPKQVGHAL
jgi:hypothetical protein